MEGHDREAEALQSGQKTLIPDCSPSVQGLQSVYRRTRVRILKDWLKNAVLYIQEYGVKRERAKSVKPVVQFHILVELEIVLYTCLMQGIDNYFLFVRREKGAYRRCGARNKPNVQNAQ